MQKKGHVKKRKIQKKMVHEHKENSSAKDPGVERVLLENFVSLQRVLTNLSVKLDSLSTQMTKLLDLFEISARALAEKDFELGGDNKDVVEKLDKLLDQNKILAKGISLMHERIPREQYYPQIQQQPQPVQQNQIPMQQKKQNQQQPSQYSNQQQPSQYIKELPPRQTERQTESIMKPREQRMSFSQEIPDSEEEELIPPRFESPME